MEVIKVESWQPDYMRTCANCDTPHVVTGVAGGKVVYQGRPVRRLHLGEAAMLDPDNWNRS